MVSLDTGGDGTIFCGHEILDRLSHAQSVFDRLEPLWIAQRLIDRRVQPVQLEQARLCQRVKQQLGYRIHQVGSAQGSSASIWATVVACGNAVKTRLR